MGCTRTRGTKPSETAHEGGSSGDSCLFTKTGLSLVSLCRGYPGEGQAQTLLLRTGSLPARLTGYGWNTSYRSRWRMSNRKSSSTGRYPRWIGHMSRVYVALMRDRRNLRRAARYSGNPGLKRLFRRLAMRRLRDAREIADSSGVDIAQSSLDSSVGALARDIGMANEVSTVAACLRSNRKLRIAIERTLAASPPDRIAQRLKLLRTSAGEEAGTLEARLRDIAVQGLPSSPTIVE